jgi:uncharacterized glyoxalase superfamily protein PhnB
MVDNPVMTFTPPGWRTVTPRIFVVDPKGVVEFIRAVFEATGEFRTDRPTVLTVGDSMVMISGTEVRAPMPAFLYVYVKDTDAAFRRAVSAGARAIEEPSVTPYGDYRCMIEDRWGNTWQIATCRP